MANTSTADAASMVRDAEASLQNIRREIEVLKARERAAIDRLVRARRWRVEVHCETAVPYASHNQAQRASTLAGRR